MDQQYSSLQQPPAGGSMPAGVRGVDEYGRNVAAAAGQAALGMGQFGLGLNQQYKDQYQPYDAKLMGFVDHLGSDGYRNAQRATAMNTVQQQSDAQRQQVQRQMAAQGVNLSDPRYAFLQGQQAQQAALGKTMAAMGSDRNARDEWVKGLGAINAMGLKVGELGLKNLQGSADMAKTGLMGMDLGASAQARDTHAQASAASAAASGQSAAAAGMNAATNARQTDLNYNLGLGRLALERYGIDEKSALTKQELEARAKANSWGNVIGSTVAGGLTNAGINWAANGGLNQIGGWIGNLFGGSSGHEAFTPDSSVMTDAGGSFQFDP